MNIQTKHGSINFVYLGQFHKFFEYYPFVQKMDENAGDFSKMLYNFAPDHRKENRSTPMSKLYSAVIWYAAKDFPEHYRGVSWDDNGDVIQEELQAYLNDRLNEENSWRQQNGCALMSAECRNRIIDSVRATVSYVTNNFRLKLTRQAVLETEIMMLLHICAGKPVDDAARESYSRRVSPDVFQSGMEEARRSGGHVLIPDALDTEDVKLPLCTGGEGPLHLMWLENKGKNRVRIILEDSPLVRTLHQNQSVCVVMKAGAAVDFLPSFTIEHPMGSAGTMFFELCAAGLAMTEQYRKGSTWVLKMSPPVASWALAGPQNWLLADAEGKIVQGSFDPDFQLPEAPIISIQAVPDRYCMLTTDGRIFAPAHEVDWQDMISFSYDGNRVMAISSDRKLLSSDASTIHAEDVVRVCHRGDAWIALHTDGSVTTDAWPRRNIRAQAVALCDDYYVVALSEYVVLIDRNAQIIHSGRTEQPAEELACRNNYIYGRDAQDGTIREFTVTPGSGHTAAQLWETPQEGIFKQTQRMLDEGSSAE